MRIVENEAVKPRSCFTHVNEGRQVSRGNSQILFEASDYFREVEQVMAVFGNWKAFIVL
jgi:hypothetical protein